MFVCWLFFLITKVCKTDFVTFCHGSLFTFTSIHHGSYCWSFSVALYRFGAETSLLLKVTLSQQVKVHRCFHLSERIKQPSSLHYLIGWLLLSATLSWYWGGLVVFHKLFLLICAKESLCCSSQPLWPVTIPLWPFPKGQKSTKLTLSALL